MIIERIQTPAPVKSANILWRFLEIWKKSLSLRFRERQPVRDGLIRSQNKNWEVQNVWNLNDYIVVIIFCAFWHFVKYICVKNDWINLRKFWVCSDPGINPCRDWKRLRRLEKICLKEIFGDDQQISKVNLKVCEKMIITPRKTPEWKSKKTKRQRELLGPCLRAKNLWRMRVNEIMNVTNRLKQSRKVWKNRKSENESVQTKLQYY